MNETIDLQQFCPNEECGLPKGPFVKSGFRYATDGRIIVRIPANGEPDSENLSKRPAFNRAESFFSPLNGDGIPWPTTGAFRGKGECQECNGHGVVETVLCKTCQGAGEDECPECGHTEECRNCKGEGVTGGKTCPLCDGKKEVDQILYRTVGRHRIRGKYDAKISRLPNVKVFPNEDPVSPMRFVFDGGEGVVIGMKVDP